MKRTAGVVGAIAVHLLVVSALHGATARIVPPPFWKPPERANEDARLRDMSEHLVSVQIKPDTAEGQRLADEDACKGSSYIGMGVMLRFADGSIIAVGDHTPASRAGLHEGDILLNAPQVRQPHNEGDRLTLRVRRGLTEFLTNVRYGKICSEGWP
jgi:hypothetical protein